MPHKITIGVGDLIIANGFLDGRPVVVLRPVAERGQVGDTPPIFGTDDGQQYLPGSDDVVMVIDGHPDVLIRALAAAGAHLLDQEPS